VDIAVVAEPYRVPPNRDMGGRHIQVSQTVAITWRSSDTSLPYTFIENGRDNVVVRWGKWRVVGVYFIPRFSVAQLDRRLDRIQATMGTMY